MIRRFEIRKAQRQQIKVKVALDGPSGSGKTLSALFIAHGLCGDWNKIAIADTENGSALYYAGRSFDLRSGERVVIPTELNHIDFTPPYHPESWIGLINEVARQGFEVLVLDSISHEWEGEGGCLDLAGGNFNNWAKVTPLHRAFIDAMRACPLHIVATMRSKQEFAMSEKDGPNGRKRAEVVKLGMKANQRENTDYEFGVALSIEHETHLAKTNKDRTGLFDGRSPFLITPAVGAELALWANEGQSTQPSAVAGEVVHPEMRAILPWIERIDATRAGTVEQLDAVRTEMNATLTKRTKMQGEALRRAIETARAAIHGRAERPPAPIRTEEGEADPADLPPIEPVHGRAERPRGVEGYAND